MDFSDLTYVLIRIYTYRVLRSLKTKSENKRKNKLYSHFPLSTYKDQKTTKTRPKRGAGGEGLTSGSLKICYKKVAAKK